MGKKFESNELSIYVQTRLLYACAKIQLIPHRRVGKFARRCYWRQKIRNEFENICR
jgi:hypothetical protein